jgi:hypothetical protein
MEHRANRRRFLETAVGSSVGAWIATGVSGQADVPKNAGSSAIPDAGGVAKKFWIDPSNCRVASRPMEEGPHRIPYFPAYAEACPAF